MSETTTDLPIEGGETATIEQTPATTPAPDGTEQTPQTADETPPAKPVEDEAAKKERAIARLTREKWEARRQAAAFEARLQEIERSQAATRDPNAPLTTADVDRLAAQKAVELRAQEAFNDQCNQAFEAGIKAFPDFESTLSNFRSLGGLPPALVEAALETDAPAALLHHLGSNLEEAEGLLKLSPARLGAAVAKLAGKLAAPTPAPVSKAPPPIKPIVASGTVSDVEPKDVNEWMRWRQRQLRR